MSSFVQKLRDLFGLTIIEDSPLEQYCLSKFVVVPNKAYKNKRAIASLSYPMSLNELITPNAWVVQNLSRQTFKNPDILNRVKSVGNVVAKFLTWTDDKNLSDSGDYYLYPAETITLKKGDCEDHAFVMASLLPEDLGVAYGFKKSGNTKYGHAFNVFVKEGKLYTIDTVSDEAELREVDSTTPWIIHYIITPKYTFLVRGGVEFGQIAGWDV